MGHLVWVPWVRVTGDQVHFWLRSLGSGSVGSGSFGPLDLRITGVIGVWVNMVIGVRATEVTGFRVTVTTLTPTPMSKVTLESLGSLGSLGPLALRITVVIWVWVNMVHSRASRLKQKLGVSKSMTKTFIC